MKISSFNKTIEQKVIKFIKDFNLIIVGDRILIALSGGSDSVFLIHFLLKYKKKYNIDLAAFHLNHKLRQESSLDQKFSEEICSKFNVPFFTANRNVKTFASKNKLSIEEAGRILRYQSLNKIAEKNNYTKIATAHNLNDNSETILLNLIKGKGLRAISGIPIKSDNIIRPIMCLTKSEIEDYLNLNKIPFIEDKSNFEPNYERNYLRLKIVPEIKSLYQDFEKTIFQTSKIFYDYFEFTDKVINEKIQKFVNFNNGDIELKLNIFRKENNFIKSEVIRAILIHKLKIEPTFKKIQEILNLINYQVGRKIFISDNYEVVKENNALIFAKKKNKVKINIKVKIGHQHKIKNKIITITKADKIEFSNNHNIEFIDADKIVGELTIRSWEVGDKFIPLGMKGSKKISDFLTDLKIPSSKRNEILILKDDIKVVNVLGYRLDERIKISKKSKNFLKIEIKNEE